MIDELREKFLGRFLAGAKQRLTRARAALDNGDGNSVMHEVHALAGEAAVLEYRDVARLARSAEVQARAWSVARDPEEAERCRATLGSLETALAAIVT